jgi:hypothetical protein
VEVLLHALGRGDSQEELARILESKAADVAKFEKVFSKGVDDGAGDGEMNADKEADATTPGSAGDFGSEEGPEKD